MENVLKGIVGLLHVGHKKLNADCRSVFIFWFQGQKADYTVFIPSMLSRSVLL